MKRLAFLLFFCTAAQAEQHYCITSENGSRTVTQCQDGTVTVVDNVNDKVVVCGKGINGHPSCEILPMKESK